MLTDQALKLWANKTIECSANRILSLSSCSLLNSYLLMLSDRWRLRRWWRWGLSLLLYLELALDGDFLRLPQRWLRNGFRRRDDTIHPLDARDVDVLVLMNRLWKRRWRDWLISNTLAAIDRDVLRLLDRSRRPRSRRIRVLCANPLAPVDRDFLCLLNRRLW